MLQSPINIVERTAVSVALPKISLVTMPTSMFIQNNKETIRMTTADSLNSANYLIFNGERYEFKNFHFHHKSEHLFNGMPDSMEMHTVFQNKQSKAVVVLGVLITRGPSGNPDLSTIWGQFPEQGNYKKVTLTAPVNISDIVNFSDKDVYYTYVGSLTTPDYNEGVAWVVLKKRLVLTADQISKFASYFPNNARSVFPVNNRFIFTGK